VKIRTDFVTNSSSESFGEVIIDNPVLLEILTRYKEMGTFGEHPPFMIGSFDDNYIPDTDITTLTPAVYCSCEDRYMAESTFEVIENIINIMDDNSSDYDWDLYQQLLEELDQRENEICDSFKKVKWWRRQELNSGKFGVWEWKFDEEDGEYYYEETTGDLSNW